MKILIPRSSPSLKGCDPFDCGIYKCGKYSVGRKKKKGLYEKISPNCGRFRCGQVTIPGEEK